MINKCGGCGALIQFDNPDLPGYINHDVYLNREKENKEILCERCFRLKHYNEVKKLTIDEDKFIDLVHNNITNNMLICYIVDLFDLSGTLVKNIRDLFPHNELLVIGNKYDLFMRSNRPTKLKKYLNDYLDENNISKVGTLIINAKEEYSAKKVYEAIIKIIDANDLSHEVFFFGMTNSGKTTLLKSIGTLVNSHEASNLVTSKAISTTLDLSRINIGDITIIDSPGLINKKQFTYYLNKKTIDYIMPNDVLKPTVFQLNTMQTIYIEGFARISLIESVNKKTSLIFYNANNIKLHRAKYQEDDEYYLRHLNDLFKIPNKNERKNLGEIKKYLFDIDENEEIAISGLGFIGTNGKCKIEIKTFEKINVVKRKKFI